MVHRDLKPGNVMLDEEGQPHLMDFGLAKRDAGEITVTQDGNILGTPAYMAPEQARGDSHDADRRADVYSLGVILFQLLTGELPFRGNARMLIHQVLHDEPPSPRKLNGAVPRDLETITLKCLEKAPDRRYQTAEAVAQELARWLDGQPIKARPISSTERLWRWARRNPAVAGLTASLVGILCIGMPTTTVLWQRAIVSETRSSASVSLLRAEQSRKEANAALLQATKDLADAEAKVRKEAQQEQAYSLALDVRAATIERDYARGYESLNRLYPLLKKMERPSYVADFAHAVLAGDSPGASVEFDVGFWISVISSVSENSRVIAWDSDGHGGVEVDLRTGAITKRVRSNLLKVARCHPLRGGQEAIVCDTSGRIAVVNLATGEARRTWSVANADEMQSRWEHVEFAVSPDEQFACWVGHDSGVGNASSIYRTDGTPIWQGDSTHPVAAFSANSRRGLIGDAVIDLETGEAVGRLRYPKERIVSAVFCDEGRTIVAGDWNGFLHVIDVENVASSPLSRRAHVGLVHSLEVSPDDKSVLSCSQDGSVAQWSVDDLRDASIPERRRYAVTSRSVVIASWTTDSRRFVTSDGRKVRVWDTAFNASRWKWDYSDDQVKLTDQDVLEGATSSGYVNDVAISPGGDNVLISHTDARRNFAVDVLDMRARRRVVRLNCSRTSSQSPSAAEQSVGLATWIGHQERWVYFDGTVLREYDLRSNRVLRRWKFPMSTDTVSVDQQSNLAAATTGDELRIWRLDTGRQSLRFRTAPPVDFMGFSPRGDRLAWIDAEGLHVVAVMSRAHAIQSSAVRSQRYGLATGAWSGSDFLVAGTSLNRTPTLLRLGSEAHSGLSGHRRGLFDVCASIDGRWIATSSYDGSIRFWDRDSGRGFFWLTCPRVEVALSNDGSRVATAGSHHLEVLDVDVARRIGSKTLEAVRKASDAAQADSEWIEWLCTIGADDWVVHLLKNSTKSSDQLTVARSLLRSHRDEEARAVLERWIEQNGKDADRWATMWLERLRRGIALVEPKEDGCTTIVLSTEDVPLTEYDGSVEAEADWSNAIAITPDEAASHIDANCIVRGRVDNVGKIPAIWFLNFSFDRAFCAVVMQSSFDRFPIGTPALYEGKTVEIIGQVTLHEGKPQIVLRDPSQIRIVEDGLAPPALSQPE